MPKLLSRVSEPDGPVVVVTDEQDVVAIDRERWRRLAEDSLRHEGVVSGELDLLFVDEDTMTDLNSQHMGKERPTDVLSMSTATVSPSSGQALMGCTGSSSAHPLHAPLPHARQVGL